MTIVRETSICKPFEVVLGAWWPTILEVGALWFRTEIKPDHIFAAEFSLEVD
jgi:hypothetical protein